MTETTVRTRFAPSPSGHLHVGGARTALFCWAYACRHEGKFILRIEDTDQKRSSDAASTGFMQDLRWLGIDWHEGPEFESCGGGTSGPYRQSERLEIYQRHIDQLLESGHAYRAFETPDELRAARAQAQAEKRNYRYDRAALALDEKTVQEYLAEERPFVVRCRVPDEADVTLSDAVRGEVTTVAAELDDFVIQKTDGYPTYHFAVVVDDEMMGVTDVIRAQEHLSNTARHMLLQDALGFRRPRYAHISVITNVDGSKMSKRDKDKTLRAAIRERGLDYEAVTALATALTTATTPELSRETWDWWQERKDRQLDAAVTQQLADALDVELPEIEVDDFRRAGYLPEVMVNYLALLGWSPGDDVEKFDRDFLIQRFDFDRIIKSPAKFDRTKLLAFNHDALQEFSPDAFASRLHAHAAAYHSEFLDRFDAAEFALFAGCNQTRSKTLDDAFRTCRFFIVADDGIEYEDSKGVRKALLSGAPNGCAHLEAVRAELAQQERWEPTALEETVSRYADAHADGKLGKVAQPLRVAVTGGTVSPAIFETLALLGRESTLHRIDRCLASHRVSAEGES